MTFTGANSNPSASLHVRFLAIAFVGALALGFGIAPTAYAATPTATVSAMVTATTTLTVTASFTDFVDATTTVSTTTNPVIIFSPDISADLTGMTTQWTSSSTSPITDVFTATYTIANPVHWASVTADVGGLVDADLNAVATSTSNAFSLNSLYHTITATAGANGSISPAGAVSVLDGGNQAFTFTPNFGYRVDGYAVNGATTTATSTSYTFSNVTASSTIDVQFISFGSASTSSSLITLPSNLITVSASYNQQMASTTVPVIFSVNGSVLPSGDFATTSVSWINGTTYFATYSVAGGLSLTNVLASVATTTDAVGGLVNALDSTTTFTVDTVAPNGTVSAPSSIVNVTNNTVTVTTDFDKAMASSTLATQFVSATSTDLGAFFASTTASWVTSQRYVAIFTALTGLNQSGILAVTSDATDTHNNPAATATSSAFAVDTIAPVGTPAVGSSVVNVVNNTITVTTTFDKAMATSTLPSIAFAAGATDVSGDFTASTTAWTNATTHVALFTAASGIYQTGVMASVSGAVDTNGNTAATSTTSSFTLDTLVPTGSATTPSSSSVVNINNDLVTITVTFNKQMASSTLTTLFENATSSADVSPSFSFITASWNAGSTTVYTTTYQAALGTNLPGVVALIGGAVDQDSNSAATSTTASFAVDTVAPTGSVSTPTASAVFNVTNNTITVTADFSKSMASTTLAVDFSLTSIYPYLATTTASWTASSTYVAVYSVAPGFANTSVAVSVSGATDTNGNSAALATTSPFIVDTIAPSGAVTSPTAAAVYNSVNNTINFVALFDKSMASTSPTIVFSPSSIYSYLATTTAGWTSTTTYTAVYSVSQGFNNSGVTIDISGAQDTHGNFAPATTTAAFTVDSLVPVISIITPTGSVISNIASNTVSVAVLFDKSMASTSLSFDFAGATSSDITGQFTPVSAGWTSASAYTAVFTAAPNFESLAATVGIFGATDTNGNPALAATSTAFVVDTLAPTASLSSPGDSSLFDFDHRVITVRVDYSEAMDTSITPAITFTQDLAPYGIRSLSSSWASSTEYVATYNFFGQLNDNITTTVYGGKDIHGNNLANMTIAGAPFRVETMPVGGGGGSSGAANGGGGSPAGPLTGNPAPTPPITVTPVPTPTPQPSPASEPVSVPTSPVVATVGGSSNGAPSVSVNTVTYYPQLTNAAPTRSTLTASAAAAQGAHAVKTAAVKVAHFFRNVFHAFGFF